MSRITFFAILFALLSHASWAQELWIYPPIEVGAADREALESAQRLLYQHDYDAALEIYLRLANENPGTSHGAGCLESARSVEFFRGDREAAESLRQRIVNEYAGSRFEVYAQFHALKRLPASGPEEKLERYSELLERFGAPRLEGILSGLEIEQAALQIKSLHPEIQYALADVYASVYFIPETAEEAYNLTRFGRVAFGTRSLGNVNFTTMLESALEGMTGKTVGNQPTRPEIIIVSPAPNSTVGANPSIAFQITTGDHRHPLINLHSITFKLDGVEQGMNTTVVSDIDDTLADGVNLETLTLSLMPFLSPGLHTVDVAVHSGEGQPDPEYTATITWSFMVDDISGGGDATLPSNKDSIIRAQKPHRNEGANPLLMLSHRPDIRNKSNNPIVGFDFTDVNLNGLTKATLVLNIQECDIPKRWGKNGRRIEAHPVNEPWVEGNGKHLKVQGQKTRGDGQGVTWFSPVDNDISNKQPDGSLQWMGARPYLGPVTAPPVRVKNRQTGPVEFDVTADVQAGFRDGWLLRKKNEAKFGNIRFYSKEGAAEAGNPDLAPRLILEYSSSSADAGTNAGQSVASSGHNYLKAVPRTTEGSTIKEVLQENATVAYTGQLLLTVPLNKAPVAQAAVRTAYRSWLNDSLTLANLAQSLA